MNKRLLIILSLIVLALVVAGIIIIWINNRNASPTGTTFNPTDTTLSGFPVSNPIVNPTTTSDNLLPTAPPSTPSAVISTPTIPSILNKISTTPVSGVTLSPQISSTTPPTIIYLEEGTGNLFRVTLDGQNNQQLTDSSLPGVVRTWWGISQGKLTLLAQYLNKQETVITFRGTYNLNTTEKAELVGQTIGAVAPGAIAVSPSGDRFFSLINTEAGVTGIVTEILTGKVNTVFTSHLKNWAVDWPTPTVITLTPQASANLPGVLYFLNPNNKILTRILGEELGLTTLVNHSGTKILYNRSLSELKLYSKLNKETRSLTITTLPEKCTWSRDNITIYCAVPNTPATAEYPDDWWSGEVTFNDSFWRLNTDTGETKIIWSGGRATDNNNRLDAINLIFDEISERLVFIDRWTATLWSLDLR